jgi:hypothetical protein
VPAHNALSIRSFYTGVASFSWLNSPHSPDLALNNSFLCPKLRNCLNRHKFESAGNVKTGCNGDGHRDFRKRLYEPVSVMSS